MSPLEITQNGTAYADRLEVEDALARTQERYLVEIEGKVRVEVEAEEVVAALDNEATTNETTHRALAILAADALDLADRWDRGRVTLAEVRLRAEALRDGYAALGGDL